MFGIKVKNLAYNEVTRNAIHAQGLQKTVQRSLLDLAESVKGSGALVDVASVMAEEDFSFMSDAGKKLGKQALEVAQKVAKEDAGYEAAQNFSKLWQSFENATEKGLTGSEMYKAVTGKNLGFINTAVGYFSDPTYGAGRLKAGLGAYAIGAIGMRYLSGGDLTHNARGERDIAGIPFV